MDLHLNDKSALVAGSTAGIGLEIARKLAVEGAKVIITGRNKAKLDQAVDSIRTSGGAYISGVLADAATEEGAAALVRATPNADILVNNLGIYEVKDFAAITDADWRRYFEVSTRSRLSIRTSKIIMSGSAILVDSGCHSGRPNGFGIRNRARQSSFRSSGSARTPRFRIRTS